ncbi:MAG: serine hydrolase [Planctomycetaceae bacterium]|nr:serine hydrolase [Planctomycetaceae bacterium]
MHLRANFPLRVPSSPLPFVTLGAVLVAFQLALGSVRMIGAVEPPAPANSAIDRYQPVIAALRAAVAYEMESKKLPALSIALVDDQQTVWAEGFGFADRARSRPATADTVYRVGSVSKLFTDLGVMQLVEQGKLDLDAPVSKYLPEFRPQNPFGREVTLRQLMAHRSGLVRESPVGHYFDPVEPTLAASVASLNSTTLVYPPETRTKYSNAGIATVGLVLEHTQGEAFAQYLQRVVLEPLGLADSSFELTDAVRTQLADAVMWTYDGREFPAPVFQLGTAPAGNLYSTVRDQARFLSALFAGGRGVNGRLVSAATLAQMWTPQFVAAGESAGFGLGFHVKPFAGRKRVGHGGAVYGFATEVAALPDEKLGVAVVTNVDVTNSVVRRLSDYAFKWMLAARAGEPLAEYPRSEPVAEHHARELAGRYTDGERTIELVWRPGHLLAPLDDFVAEVRQDQEGLVCDGRLAQGARLVRPPAGGLELGNRKYRRADNPAPAEIPARWEGLIGEYGWDHNTLYILEREGQLWALIEWFFSYPLTEFSADEFGFPAAGLYDGERLVFRRDAAGKAIEVEAASVVFKRRSPGGADDGVFRIRPRRAIDDVRRESLAAQPPEERGEFRAADLVELTALEPSIKLDVRYAGDNNFLGVPVYSQARAFLQRPAAEALVRAHRRLAQQGYGLLVFDGYRPWHVTRMFWEATPEAMRMFVADPSQGSRHNRGCAVDLTLYELQSGAPVVMTGGYDEFSPRSFPDYPGGTARQRWHRELLREAMEAEGFRVYEFEWWHFDFRDWKSYPILNVPFEKLQ